MAKDKLYPCPCCGYKTFGYEPYGSYEVCPVCYWEDDQIQLENPDYEGGANAVSLKQAQKNLKNMEPVSFYLSAT